MTVKSIGGKCGFKDMPGLLKHEQSKAILWVSDLFSCAYSEIIEMYCGPNIAKQRLP